MCNAFIYSVYPQAKTNSFTTAKRNHQDKRNLGHDDWIIHFSATSNRGTVIKDALVQLCRAICGSPILAPAIVISRLSCKRTTTVLTTNSTLLPTANADES